MSKVLFPGQLIRVADSEAGSGTYISKDKIYACIKGTVQPDGNIKPVHKQDPQLKIGSELIGQVIGIREDRAFIKILRVDSIKVHTHLEGVLRKQNMRLHEIDKIEINKCFIPGDIIKAKLISYGDSAKLYLTTAEDNLGVLFAKHSETHHLMIPLSWEEMVCVQSGLKEFRKVAKPNFDQFQ